MGDLKATIRSTKEGSPSATDPGRLLVKHHRSGEAEVQVGLLSGGHLLHLAVAGCVYNSVFRIAADRGVELQDCRVTVDGTFDSVAPRSEGISYEIELAAAAPADELESIAREADKRSTIPNLLRASTEVVLRDVEARVAGES